MYPATSIVGSVCAKSMNLNAFRIIASFAASAADKSISKSHEYHSRALFIVKLLKSKTTLTLTWRNGSKRKRKQRLQRSQLSGDSLRESLRNSRSTSRYNDLGDVCLILSKSKTIIDSELIVYFLDKVVSHFVVYSLSSLFRRELFNQMKHPVHAVLGYDNPILVVRSCSVSEFYFLVGEGLPADGT